MQPNSLAARAYSQNARSVGTPRSVEYQAFARVTATLRAADKPEVPLQDRIQAVLQNNKLWGLLAADLMSENNALPQSLRAQLVSLAEFARKHGLQVMSGEASLETLIDINVTIMRGLRGQEAAGSSDNAGSAQAAPTSDASGPVSAAAAL